MMLECNKVDLRPCSGYIPLICSQAPDGIGDQEDPDAYFRRHCIHHFSFAETLRLRRAGKTAPRPPWHWTPRIIPALWFAEEFRMRLNRASRQPVTVGIGNGFRPSPRHPELRSFPDSNGRVGGSRRSKHIIYRALDLDPSRNVSAELARDTAADIFTEIRDSVVVGMGFYKLSSRVHIDIGPSEPVSWGDRVRDALWGEAPRWLHGKIER